MFWIPLLISGAMSAGQQAIANKETIARGKLQNKARDRVDLRNLADAAEQIGSLGMMAAQYRQMATESSINAQREVGKAKGTAEAQAGAAGIKGASVDAVFSDLDREFSENSVAVQRNLENQQYNLGEQLRSLQHQTANGLLGQLNPRAGTSSALTAGLTQAGSMYANAYFQYGAQKTT